VTPWRVIPLAVARRHDVVPLAHGPAGWRLAARDPEDPELHEALERLGLEAATVEAWTSEALEALRDERYGLWGELFELARALEAQPLEDDAPSLEGDEALERAPAVRYVGLLLGAAFGAGATDLHLDPPGGEALEPLLRVRIDGVLVERPAPPAWLYPRVVARLKALANMDLGQSREHQDGTIAFDDAAGRRDLRVATAPTELGEAVVLRVLARDDELPSLEGLGLGRQAGLLRSAAGEPTGLILVAGPTGAGKTTTLHALVSAMDTATRSVVSLEDPVEIRRGDVRQIPIRRDAGASFAAGLRSVLRQDPDVILVGEARDRETAQLVVEAALAGHLVLTTVHASTAAGALERFVQLGCDPAHLAESLRLVVAQRLVRRRCGACAGSGCPRCDAGLRGRAGVFETRAPGAGVTATLRVAQTPAARRRALGAAAGQSFAAAAAALLAEGATTEAELQRVLGSDLDEPAAPLADAVAAAPVVALVGPAASSLAPAARVVAPAAPAPPTPVAAHPPPTPPVAVTPLALVSAPTTPGVAPATPDVAPAHGTPQPARAGQPTGPRPLPVGEPRETLPDLPTRTEWEALEQPVPRRVRDRCRVVLDLRHAAGVGAVAWDPRSSVVVGWALRPGHDGPAIDQALTALGARPRELRVLIGAEQAPLARLEGAEPELSDVLEALLRSGQDVPSGPLTCARVADADGSLCAALAEAQVHTWLRTLEACAPEGFSLHHASLLQRARLRPGEALLERGAHLNLLGVPANGRAVSTRARVHDRERLWRRLDATGARRVVLVGADREPLRAALRAARPRLEVVLGALPRCGDAPLPEVLEQAATLARSDDDGLGSFPSQVLCSRARGVRRANRLALAGACLALLGLLLACASWPGFARERARAGQLEAARGDLVAGLVRARAHQRREADVDVLERCVRSASDLDRRPGTLLARLVQACPPGLGLYRLRWDGQLAVEVGGGRAAPAQLARFRAELARLEGLQGLSWDAAHWDPESSTLRQTFRADVRRGPPR